MNPFKYGQVVSKEDFCPRPVLLKSLKDFIKSGQNVLIQGERRIGKTSLIHEAVRKLRGVHQLYIDLLEIKTVDNLFRRMLRGIISLEERSGFVERVFSSISQLKPSLTMDPLTGQPSISLDASLKMRPDSIEGLLDFIDDYHKKKSIVVVFDEFQDILKIREAPETLAILRSKIQFHSEIAYLFAGSVRNDMYAIFNHPKSALFKSAVTINVGPIDKNRFKEFLIEKFAIGKRKIKELALDKVFEFADDIPGDIQQLCGTLWEVTEPRKIITIDDIPNALELIYSRESKGYEAILGQITGLQLRILAGITQVGGKSPLSSEFLKRTGVSLPASAKKALDRLIKIHILYRYEGEYKFVNPFFNTWLIFKGY